MALLLKCLRDVRMVCGDLDLLPPSASADALSAEDPRHLDEPGDASPRSEIDDASWPEATHIA